MEYKSHVDGRAWHFQFDCGYTRDFIEASKEIEIPDLSFIPYKRYLLSKIFMDIFGYSFSVRLLEILRDYQSGCIFLHFGEQVAKDDCIRLSTAISHQISRPSASDSNGLFYAIIKIVDDNKTEMKLYEPYKDFPLHTDGVFKDNPVDWLLMMKVSEFSASGGESRLLHIEDWEEWDSFYNRPENQKQYMHGLIEKDKRYESFRKISSLEPSFSQILSIRDAKKNVKFVDQYVVPSTTQEATFIHELQESIEKSRGIVNTRLPVGSMILLNNNFWMHGRTKFQENPNLHREL